MVISNKFVTYINMHMHIKIYLTKKHMSIHILHKPTQSVERVRLQSQ